MSPPFCSLLLLSINDRGPIISSRSCRKCPRTRTFWYSMSSRSSMELFDLDFTIYKYINNTFSISHSRGNSTAGLLVCISNSRTRFSFHCLRCTCQQPRPNVAAGIESISHPYGVVRSLLSLCRPSPRPRFFCANAAGCSIRVTVVADRRAVCIIELPDKEKPPNMLRIMLYFEMKMLAKFSEAV